jgi:hypothetical protein
MRLEVAATEDLAFVGVVEGYVETEWHLHSPYSRNV